MNLTTPALPHLSPVNTVNQNPNTDNTRAPHAPSGPSQVSNKQGLERHPTEATARVEQTPKGTARKPPSQWNKVKKYCIRCEERRLNGGYKLHHCTDCEYHVVGEAGTGAQGAAPRLRNSTPIRTEKIYCSRCIEKKNTRGPNGRPQSAKYNCAACVTLRSDAKSRETSKSQGPSQGPSQSSSQPGPQSNPQPGAQSNLQPESQSDIQPGPQSNPQPGPQPAEAALTNVAQKSEGWQWPTREPSPWPTTTIRWSEVRLSPDQSALPPSPLGPAFQPWGRNAVLYPGIGRDVLSARPIEDLLTNQDGWCSWM